MYCASDGRQKNCMKKLRPRYVAILSSIQTFSTVIIIIVRLVDLKCVFCKILSGELSPSQCSSSLYSTIKFFCDPHAKYFKNYCYYDTDTK